MSKRNRKHSDRPIGKGRSISIRSELRKEPDVHKIARAVIALALAQAEAEAEKQTNTMRSPEQNQVQDGVTPDA